MPYGNLLKKKIKEKNFTYEEIARQCAKQGVTISTTYLKDITTGIKNPPKEDKSRAIAKVLGIDEKLLVVEGYLDKAPEEIKQVFKNIRNLSTTFGLYSIDNKISKKELELIECVLEGQSLSEFILEFLEDYNANFIHNKNFSISSDNMSFIFKYNNFSFYEVVDNSMAPLLEKGDHVTIEIQTNYSNGNIIALKIQGYKEIIYRKIFYNKETITLMPIAKGYKEITYNKSDIEIIGRVNKVIREL